MPNNSVGGVRPYLSRLSLVVLPRILVEVLLVSPLAHAVIEKVCLLNLKTRLSGLRYCLHIVLSLFVPYGLSFAQPYQTVGTQATHEPEESGCYTRVPTRAKSGLCSCYRPHLHCTQTDTTYLAKYLGLLGTENRQSTREARLLLGRDRLASNVDRADTTLCLCGALVRDVCAVRF